KEFEARRPNAMILLTPVPDPTLFGVAELAGGKVVRLVEKPKEPKSNLALVGVYLFDKNVFEAIEAIRPSWRNELEITDAIQYLVDNGRAVQPHLVSGWWKDTGKLEDMLEANRLILETIESRNEGEVDAESRVGGQVVLEKGVVLRNAVIRGPAIIGEGSEVADAYVGPFTAIGRNCRVVGTEIEHSIVLEGSEIVDIGGRIDESLIGREVKIYKCPPKPSVFRFMVGDKSEIGIK
ncbi:MAG: glucose-1-phosphate thymidylyltransferase, partial [Candidatus Aminicenantes bacterium]|nr:glucose-1-phosphate thymidylyltransferase [Candidatus Aminicenantes bacterium]